MSTLVWDCYSATMYRKTQRIHFVGIGGIGMSGIAEVLLNLGYQVSGTDLRETDLTRRLAGLGGEIHVGHDAQWVDGSDVVVVSSAVRANNPEVIAARQALIPVIPRAEMLAELMRLKKYGIAIAGSHGKTTTTSLIAWILASAGLDPTVITGGKVNSLGSNAKLGQGEFLVAEADESDGSFVKLSPAIVVVTNVDREHLDFYRDLADIKAAFLQFINRIPFYGAAVLCLDDPNISDLLSGVEKRFVTYGVTAQADVQARGVVVEGLRSRFELCIREQVLGEIRVSLPGVHNVYNALAAIAVAWELDIPFSSIAQALESFTGVQRRLQIRGEAQDIMVVDDYGHHPTEIKATLAALRAAWGSRRLLVLFQPHRYTRTQALFDEFTTAFFEADMLFLTEIYPAGEPPIPGVSAEALLDGIKRRGHRQAMLAGEVSALVEAVMPHVAAGDIVLTLGAGNIWEKGEEILRRLQGDGNAGGAESKK